MAPLRKPSASEANFTNRAHSVIGGTLCLCTTAVHSYPPSHSHHMATLAQRSWSLSFSPAGSHPHTTCMSGSSKVMSCCSLEGPLRPPLQTCTHPVQ